MRPEGVAKLKKILVVLALGVAPGPRVGEILKAVYEQQLDGELTTTDDAIAAASRLLTQPESREA